MTPRRERTVGDAVVAHLKTLYPVDEQLHTVVLAALTRLGLADTPAPRRNDKHYRWQRVCSGCGHTIGHSPYCSILSLQERRSSR